MSIKPISISSFDLREWLKSENEKPIIIDVREELELEIAKFSLPVIHIPISKVSIDYVSLKLNNLENKKFVVLCHMGIRSYHFGQWLLENNFVIKIWNLDEGIDGWSKYIDANIDRY